MRVAEAAPSAATNDSAAARRGEAMRIKLVLSYDRDEHFYRLFRLVWKTRPPAMHCRTVSVGVRTYLCLNPVRIRHYWVSAPPSAAKAAATGPNTPSE